MPKYIETLGQQAGGQVATGLLGAGMGLLLQGGQDRRQLRQQQKLQDMEIAGSKQMTDYNMSKQLQMWKDTSYGAQMEQMEKAGLNPGLMYGMGGGGGVTTGNANGNVSGGQAPHGGGEAMTGMAIMQNSQLALMNAQKDKLKAEAAEIRSRIPVNTNTGEGLGIENEWKKGTLEARIQQQKEQLGILETQNKLDAAARLDRQLQIANEALKTGFESTGQDIKNDHEREKIKQTMQDVANSLEQVAQGWKGLSLQEVDLKIKTFLAEYTANHPELGKVMGGLIQRIGAAFGKPNNEVKISQ